MPQPELDQFFPVFGRRVAAVGMHNAIRVEPPVAHRISNASTTSSVRIWSAIAYPITSRVAQSISEAILWNLKVCSSMAIFPGELG
jgi:hypothetical protein